jgi:carbon storage regulator
MGIMLVLTRKPGESILIGDNIKVTVVSLGPGRVKIGIDAPPAVRVDREEVHARKVSEEDVVTLSAADSGTVPAPETERIGIAAVHNRIAEKLPEETPPPRRITALRKPR